MSTTELPSIKSNEALANAQTVVWLHVLRALRQGREVADRAEGLDYQHQDVRIATAHNHEGLQFVALIGTDTGYGEIACDDDLLLDAERNR